MDHTNKGNHHSILLLTTVLYSAVVISFGKYEITRVVPFVIYPAMMIAFSDISLKSILKKLILIEPLIIGVGLMNPFFEKETFQVLSLSLSYGWISLLSLFLRGTLILFATIVLSEKIQLEEALIGLRLPPLFVTQLAITYRYIGLLTREIKSVMLAYKLRSSHSKRVDIKHMGSLLGHFFIRTLDKANRVHHAMVLRGFDGSNHRLSVRPLKISDIMVFIFWGCVFIGLRVIDVSDAFGRFVLGGGL